MWFPLWPIQRIRSGQPEVKRHPLALYDTTSGGERLAVCSPMAARHGLRPGMFRAEAEMLASRVLLLPTDPAADRETLHQLAMSCRKRFSPMTATEETERPECLFLDLKGCAHLFKGERELVRAAVRFLRAQDWKLRCALADTVGAAWALAHWASRSVVIVPSAESEASLKPLPIAALRLPQDAVKTLDELGIEYVGHLLRFPRAELASRFEPLVVQRIRQALGMEPELLVAVRESEPIVARWASEDPVSDQAALELICGELLNEIVGNCLSRGGGLLRCLCRLEGPGHRSETYPVELIRPSDDVRHILNLMTLQWEQRPFPESVHTILVEASRTVGRSVQSGTLFAADRSQEDRQAVGRLIERLSSRLGKDSVLRASLSPDAQPEFAVTYKPCVDDSPPPTRSQKATTPEPVAALPWERPLTLLLPAGIMVWSVVPDGPPQRVRWREQLRAVVRWWGPERIEAGWWRGRQCRREYYRVELETGEWLWIFRRRPEGDWVLQGVFD